MPDIAYDISISREWAKKGQKGGGKVGGGVGKTKTTPVKGVVYS
jgi:hypothetical protein